MNNTLRVVASSLVVALAASGVWGAEEYLLYAPGPSDGKRSSGPDEGVLVKSVTIQKGDTLYSLSRRYGGKGIYFPQILLFNEIRNPDLIYAGNKLLVPLQPESGKGADSASQAKAEVGQKPAKSRQAGKVSHPAPHAREAKEVRKEQTAPQVQSVSPKPQHPPAAAPKAAVEPSRPVTVPKKAEETEQFLYEQGVSAYKIGSYQQSVDHFDRFLARYPASPLVPDATLYRADALLKLAGQ